MPKTKQISVTTTPTAITVQTLCKSVKVFESQANANWPTTDYQISAPLSTDDVMYRQKGFSWEFTARDTVEFNAFFQPGQVLGYISLPTGGPANFTQYEE